MTIEFNGTGGLMEGDFGTADINVNLDPVLHFDGNVDYIDCSTNTALDLNDNFTLSLWFKADNTSGYKWLAGRKQTDNPGQEGYLLFLDGAYIVASVSDGTTESEPKKSGKYVAGAWNHVAAVCNRSDSSNEDWKLYINGVMEASTDLTSTGVGDITGNGLAFRIGEWGGTPNSAYSFEGNIADVRFYNTALSATNVQVLASKINIDSSLGAGTTNLLGWWKINIGTGVAIDNAAAAATTLDGTATNFTMSGSSSNWLFDAFSVNAQDTVTTDGTFTVTQGKLEGLALSSVDFDNIADEIQIADISTLDMNGKNWSLCAWTKVPASDTSSNTIMSKGPWETGNYQLRITSGVAKWWAKGFTPDNAAGSISCNDGNWHHIVALYDGSNMKLYVNGILDTTTAVSGSSGNNSSSLWIGSRQTDYFFDGNIRDCRVYDYALSDDQVVSLYSGSYNVTPVHGWKLDEGRPNVDGSEELNNAVGAFEDWGTGTDVDGQGVSLVDASCVNGTLDLDSTLTIATNGTLSAPRGELDINGVLSRSGTFTHNNGTVDFTAAGTIVQGTTMTGANAFYDLKTTGSVWYRIDADIDIHHEAASGYLFWIYGSTVTMGTDDYASGTDNSDDCIGWSYIYGASGVTSKLYAANQLKPWRLDISSGNHSFIKSDQASYMSTTYLKWGNIIGALTTGGNTKSLILDGDMEFDAVTIAANDTLDLNGQRMEHSGILRVSGLLNSTGGGLLIAHNSINMAGGAEKIHDGDLNVITDGGTTHDWRLATSAGNGGGPWCRNLLVNGSITHQDQIGPSSGSSFYNPESIIVGNGTLTQPGGHTYLKDLTIATGGTFAPTHGSNKDVDLYGDFTTSGGLLGKSCLDLTGSSSEYATNTGTTWGFEDNYTIEFWFKSGSDANMTLIDIRDDAADDEHNRIHIFTIASANEIRVVRYNFEGSTGSGTTTTSDGTFHDGKWHHVAVTSGASGCQIFYDGKLNKTNDYVSNRASGQTLKLHVGRRSPDDSGSDGGYFTGSIDELRIWSDVRTVGEIRHNMFRSGYANFVADDGTTASYAGLEAAYDFDEGQTDTAACLEDGSPNTARNVRLYNASGLEAVDLWPTAGGFTIGTSTLKFSKSGTQNLYCLSGQIVYGLTIDAGSTTNISTVDTGAGQFYPRGPLVINGIMDSDRAAEINFNDSFISAGTITVGSSGSVDSTPYYPIWRFTHTSGTISLPAISLPKLLCQGSGGTTTLTGDLTATVELGISSGHTFNYGGNDVTTKLVNNASGGIVNMDKGSSLIFTDESGAGFGTSAGTLNCSGEAAAIFDGTSDYISIADNAALDLGTSDFSFSGWIKLNALGDYKIIYDKGSGTSRYGFLLWSDNRLAIHIEGNFISSLTIADTNWHFVAVSCNRDGNATFYLDGASNTVDISGKVDNDLTNTNDLRIGIRYDLADHWFNGSMADLRIYSDVITSGEVTTLYQAGTGAASNPATNGGNTFAVHADNLVGHWKLNEAGLGRAYDFSGNMNHGVNTGVIDGTDDPSARFDATNDYIDLGTGTDLELTNNYTISLWCKNDDASRSGTEHLIGKYTGGDGDRGYRINVASSNRIAFGSGNSGGIGSSEASYDFDDHSIPWNQWNHIACTYASGVMKIFINGTERRSTDNSGTQTTTYNPAAEKLVIGAYQEGANGFWDGEIADVRLYKVVLNATDITALAGQGSTTTPVTSSYVLTTSTSNAEPTAWWKLGDAISALDSVTANSNHGVPYGARPNRIRVMSEVSQKTTNFSGSNYWDFNLGAGNTVNLDHTTIEHAGAYDILGTVTATINIDNCSFQYSDREIYFNGNSVSSFTNTTIDSMRRGLRLNGTPYTGFDNITITNSSAEDIRCENQHVELNNSSFDLSKTLLGSGAILSKNHTSTGAATVALDCQMILPGAYNMSLFTGTGSSSIAGQNVTIYKHASYTPVLTINATGKTYGGLIIPAGSAVTHASTHAFTVSGDVNITGSGALYTGGTGVPTFGSLTIGASGTYSATSGITTITNKTVSASALTFAGTFTHNNGTVKLAMGSTVWANVYPNSEHFYNMIIDTALTEGYYFQDPLIVLNNLDIQDGTIYANSAESGDGDITVHGLTTVGTGADVAKLENVARTVTLNGGITVGANGTFETGTGTNNVSSLRNLGGTVT